MNSTHNSIRTITIVASILAAVLLIGPGAASSMQSDTWTGTIQGFSYVNGSKYYPVDANDPLAAAEPMFVFVDGSAGKEFYLLDNVDRGFLSGYIGKQVRLTGIVKHIQYRKVIEVERLDSRNDSGWRAKWHKSDQSRHIDY